MFGVTKSTDGVLVPAPVLDNTVKMTKVGSSSGATYYYWQAQYHMRNGKVGVSSQIDLNGSYPGTANRVGVSNTDIQSFNDTNHNSLTLKRTATDHGILIYRQNFTGVGTAGNATGGQLADPPQTFEPIA